MVAPTPDPEGSSPKDTRHPLGYSKELTPEVRARGEFIVRALEAKIFDAHSLVSVLESFREHPRFFETMNALLQEKNDWSVSFSGGVRNLLCVFVIL